MKATKTLEEQFQEYMLYADSPYYRIRLSFYSNGKYLAYGVLYLYLPKRLNEIRIKQYLNNRFKDFNEKKFTNFSVLDYKQVKKEDYDLHKGLIITDEGQYSLKRKLSKNQLLRNKVQAKQENLLEHLAATGTPIKIQKKKSLFSRFFKKI